MVNPRTDHGPDHVHDVVIMGGGAAGLTLARQLTLHSPDLSVVIVERNERAVEAAHKVGESTVDISAHYLRETLRITDHLGEAQLEKFGMRFFFTQGHNRDIARRVELGHDDLPRAGATYQIDRGRFENHLTDALRADGVRVLTSHKIHDVTFGGAGPHRIGLTGEGGQTELKARWIVDATGRAGTLKRKLNLAKPNGHNVNAVWFRLNSPIDVGEWSTDAAWQGRIKAGRRYLSTNHLAGEGYWVWLIPLSSEAMSIGIVADPDLHPFDSLNTFDKALTWLGEHEPQCAEAVRARTHQRMDFRVLKNYSYGCTQMFSEDRWCLTGEAGIFLDPLYSPGLDMISLGNGLITDLIHRSLKGEDVSELAAIHNTVFFLIADGWLPIYEGQYPILGNARVMSAKIIWDIAVYWAVPSLLFHHDQFPRLIDRPEVVAQLARLTLLTVPVQRFFRQWCAVEPSRHADDFVGFYDFDFMSDLHRGMARGLSDPELGDQLRANLDLLEGLAAELISSVTKECSNSTSPIRQDQAEQWCADKALQRIIERRPHDGAPPRSSWLKLLPAPTLEQA
ncbi:NAD(P)/FAD-dependent oxidoreductase [Kribbella sp. CA-294648]|uniref:NAD(P)/FAD-dependent oxidoreductase n=1 Tax=Kribbella sp. CA-294648 TaxID=3239948 RepID=UPI003D8E9EA0